LGEEWSFETLQYNWYPVRDPGFSHISLDSETKLQVTEGSYIICSNPKRVALCCRGFWVNADAF
jgi:hypothetical protein